MPCCYNRKSLIVTTCTAARVYKNKVSDEVVAMERRPGGCEFKDIQHLVSGQRGAKVYELGDPDYGIWTCGISGRDIIVEEVLALMSLCRSVYATIFRRVKICSTPLNGMRRK